MISRKNRKIVESYKTRPTLHLHLKIPNVRLNKKCHYNTSSKRSYISWNSHEKSFNLPIAHMDKKKTSWPETAVHLLASVQYIKVVFKEQAINFESNVETDLDIRHSTLGNWSNI